MVPNDAAHNTILCAVFVKRRKMPYYTAVQRHKNSAATPRRVKQASMMITQKHHLSALHRRHREQDARSVVCSA
jgi:hypothetical protein